MNNGISLRLTPVASQTTGDEKYEVSIDGQPCMLWQSLDQYSAFLSAAEFLANEGHKPTAEIAMRIIGSQSVLFRCSLLLAARMAARVAERVTTNYNQSARRAA